MNRRPVLVVLLALALIAALGYAVYARSASSAPTDVVATAGDVRVDEIVVRAPAILYPTPDYSIGMPTPATAKSAARKKPAATSPSRLPVVAGFLAQAAVSQGEHVRAGQVLARLDTTMLELGVRQARTARDRASANLDVLDKNLDKLATTRSTILKTRSQLVRTKASVEATIATLEKTRSSLEASIALIREIVSQPGGPPPHVPPYPVLLQQMQGMLAGLDAGLSGARAGVAKIDAGIRKIDSGLATMATARSNLGGVRDLAVINLRAARVGVRLAEAALAQATIVAPSDGTVTYVRPAGSAVMAGAPIVRIRPDGPAHVYTYLTADQLERVSVGSRASVTFDSLVGAPLSGRVTSLGTVANVPPTSFPTSIVHMTRAVRVTIELDGDTSAPPGTPVDIEIRASR